MQAGWVEDELVGANTGSFESFGGQLLVLVGDHVYTEREVVDVGTLATQVKDADLRVGNTAVEAGLGIRLLKETLALLWGALTIDKGHSKPSMVTEYRGSTPPQRRQTWDQ